jgi:hypothetical protein
MQLLAMIADEELPRAELLEMIQRLHVPGYEEARPHLSEAVSSGLIEPNLPDGFHWQRDLETIIATYGEES